MSIYQLRWLIKIKKTQPFGQTEKSRTLQMAVRDKEAYAALKPSQREQINKDNFPIKWVDIPEVKEEVTR